MAHPTNGKYKKISKSKQKRLTRLYRRGTSITELSRQHGLSKSSIYYWGHKYYAIPHSIKAVTTQEFNSLKQTASRTAHKLEICQKCLRGLELTPKEKYAFMDSIYGQYSLHEICEAMDVNRGTYYNHLRVKDKIGQQEIRRAMLKEEIMAVYDASAHRYGSGRIAEALRRRGIKTSRKTVSKLMRELGIGYVQRHRKTASAYLAWEDRKSETQLRQDKATKKNQVWTSDLMMIRYKQHNYYLCVYLDEFTRVVLAHRLGPRASTNLVIGTLRKAVAQRKPAPGLILHTDHGGQYFSYMMERFYRQHHIYHQASRPHVPTDNAMMESFFKTMREEFLLDPSRFRSLRTLKEGLDEYIGFYNNMRLHTSLHGLAPTEYERQNS